MYFKVLAVLFLGEISQLFSPFKKACGSHEFRHRGVRRQYRISYLAHVWARQGNVEPALRILLYVDQHPAALARDKNFNATLLAAWREALAPEIYTEAAAWGKTKQLDDVVVWIDGEGAHASEVALGP